METRKGESGPLLLMFFYSFLAMTSYNIVKPLTRAQFIQELGADDLPLVLLVSGVLIGFVMQGYGRVISWLPPKSVIATTQIGMAVMLVGFWALFQAVIPGTSIAFYFVGQMLGLLLISQFWTLANDVYDPRQAKRLFGFIGGGASLGGMTGSAILTFTVERVGPNNLLLVSSALLVVCAFVVTSVIRTAGDVSLEGIAAKGDKKGVGGAEAFRMLRESKHLQLIALIIGFAAIGAGLLDQQLNMAVEETQGDEGAAGIAALLGEVQLYLSIAGFVIQIWLTSRIHRYLGIGFALLILPVGLGATGAVILLSGAFWAAALGRVLDSSLRYTVDKTTREILFLPLPGHIKHQAKPFVDVTVDRFAKGIGAALTLVLIKPWGFNLSWPQLSVVSLTVTVLWIFGAIKARQGYLSSFRESIAQQGVEPKDVRLTVADLSTVEALVEELAHPNETRLLYAIDLLESLDKRNLITPLLLHHESAAIRARALQALGSARSEVAGRWVPVIQKLIKDESPEVRAAAIGALARVSDEDAMDLARKLLADHDPRIVATAAVVLAGSERLDDRTASENALSVLAADTRESASEIRRDLAAAIRQVGASRSKDLLIPLLHDPDPTVAEEAMRSVRSMGPADFIFAPTLISLLGSRRLKSGAREALVAYGPPVVDVLKYFLTDQAEDRWVRRHLPATLARIPCQQSMDILIAALEDTDGFLRFKVLTAIEKLRREHPSLSFRQEPVETLLLREGRVYFHRLGLHYNLFTRSGMPKDSVLAQAIDQKLERVVDRIYRLLGLLYPWKDIAAARWAIEHGNVRARASAIEYLDNILDSQIRHRVLPVLEELPLEEKVRRGNVMLKTRPRDVEETLLELINDDDQVVAAAAIDLIGVEEMWNLGDDVEHVLAHRDARDWYVFEAASWTLASRVLGTQRRRERWVEPLPAAALVDRMRRLALFSSVGIDELFRIAGAGHQVRHEPGIALLREGAVPDTLHLLLDGRATAAARGSSPRDIVPPAALGFEEVLDGCLMSETVKTTEPTVSLALSNEEMRTLLADNTDLVQGLFRTLAAGREYRPGPVKGVADTEFEGLGTGVLTRVQKIMALQRVPLFANVSGAEILYLASIATQIPLEAEAVLAEHAGSFGLGIVLSGELTLRSTEQPALTATAGPGDSVGIYETLVGVDGPRDQTTQLVVTQAGSALQIERDELFDLLGQRPDLLQQVFAAVFDRMHEESSREALHR